MPLPVVPILASPRAFSRAWSSRAWTGSTSGVASEIFRRSRTFMPAFSTFSISRSRSGTLSTTPLPIRQATPSRMIPEGIRFSAIFWPLITSVWPALWPPWKRTTAWTLSVSRSTTLPFPSSPHCAPMTTTVLPISVLGTQSQQFIEVGGEARRRPRHPELAADAIVAPAARQFPAVAGREGREHHAGLVAVAAQLGQVHVHRHLRELALERAHRQAQRFEALADGGPHLAERG